MSGRDYSIVRHTFWTGETGRKIRRAGSDAQRVSFYLITCQSSNMIGLYYLPLPLLCHELDMEEEAACKALSRVCETGFCLWDAPSEHVFVIEMAAHQIGEPLDVKDNRVKGILREWQSMRKSPFYKDFYNRYADSYHLPVVMAQQAPSKPLPSQEQEQDQDQEQEHDHVAGESSNADKPQSKSNGTARANGKQKEPFPPTVEMVAKYVATRTVKIDPERFVDTYASKGWMVGTTPMKDWRAAVRNWEKNLVEAARKSAEEPKRGCTPPALNQALYDKIARGEL